jgi:hypothetical protein
MSSILFSKFFSPKLVFSVGALAKNGSFGFSALDCVSAKTKCAICAVGCLFTMRHNVFALGEGGV